MVDRLEEAEKECDVPLYLVPGAQPAPIGWLDAGDLRALRQGNAVWLHPEDQGRMVPVYSAAAAPEATIHRANGEKE